MSKDLCSGGNCITISNPSRSRGDYPSGRDIGGGGSGDSSSGSKSNDYSLSNIESLPRIASSSVFAATCHGSIVVDSIIHHAITKNSQGYGADALASLRSINLSHNYLEDHDIEKLNDGLYGYKLSLQVFNFCNNNMGAVGLDHLIKGSIGIDHLRTGGNDIHNMMQGILTLPTTSIVCLNLANNNIGDIGAGIIGHALINGRLPHTRHIDISGNGISETGDNTAIVQALKGIWQDIAVFTHTLDEILKMDEGSREEKVAIYRGIIEKGRAAGTYDEAMVVDKSFLGKISNAKKGIFFGGKWLFGFGKCHLLPEPEQVAESYAQDKIIATLPQKTSSGLSFVKKYVGKLISFHDIVTCFVSSREDALTSELGQELVKHDLCLMGEEEFCGE